MRLSQRLPQIIFHIRDTICQITTADSKICQRHRPRTHTAVWVTPFIAKKKSGALSTPVLQKKISILQLNTSWFLQNFFFINVIFKLHISNQRCIFDVFNAFPCSRLRYSMAISMRGSLNLVRSDFFSNSFPPVRCPKRENPLAKIFH